MGRSCAALTHSLWSSQRTHHRAWQFSLHGPGACSGCCQASLTLPAPERAGQGQAISAPAMYGRRGA